jgi:hypothetical protein
MTKIRITYIFAVVSVCVFIGCSNNENATSTAVMSERGYYVPGGIWTSKEYKQSLELDKTN